MTTISTYDIYDKTISSEPMQFNEKDCVMRIGPKSSPIKCTSYMVWQKNQRI